MIPTYLKIRTKRAIAIIALSLFECLKLNFQLYKSKVRRLINALFNRVKLYLQLQFFCVFYTVLCIVKVFTLVAKIFTKKMQFAALEMH